MTGKRYKYAMAQLESQGMLHSDAHMFAQNILPSQNQSRDRNHDSVVPQGRFEIMGIQITFSSQEQDEAAAS